MSTGKKRMLIGTGLYLVLIFSLRGCQAWSLLWGGELNELGDFFAGVFSPVAFAWLIYGYFLQHEELEAARKALNAQADMMETRNKAERLRSTPNLSLDEDGTSGSDRNFILRNIGGPARGVELTLLLVTNGGVSQAVREPLIDTDGCKKFPLAMNSSPSSCLYYYTVLFISELHERFYQRWTIEFTEANLLPQIAEVTAGPTLLMRGQSPPPEGFGDAQP